MTKMIKEYITEEINEVKNIFCLLKNDETNPSKKDVIEYIKNIKISKNCSDLSNLTKIEAKIKINPKVKINSANDEKKDVLRIDTKFILLFLYLFIFFINTPLYLLLYKCIIFYEKIF